MKYHQIISDKLIWMKPRIKIFSFLIIIATLCKSCDTIDLFEQSKSFTRHEWLRSETPSFTFLVEDSLSFYNLYAVIRHTDAYQFNNIWLKINRRSPGQKADSQKANLMLADNTQGWMGTAFNDVIEHRILLNQQPVRLQKGEHTFTLEQIMRQNPLPFVLSAGIRVEKVVQ